MAPYRPLSASFNRRGDKDMSLEIAETETAVSAFAGEAAIAAKAIAAAQDERVVARIT
ncbi:hypothetical protein Sj15T_08810 [Sphingobium sp. TA15]|nr:hypothetical protein Sj15T_08810 [Sphingobium sp. TA15]